MLSSQPASGGEQPARLSSLGGVRLPLVHVGVRWMCAGATARPLKWASRMGRALFRLAQRVGDLAALASRRWLAS